MSFVYCLLRIGTQDKQSNLFSIQSIVVRFENEHAYEQERALSFSHTKPAIVNHFLQQDLHTKGMHFVTFLSQDQVGNRTFIHIDT